MLPVLVTVAAGGVTLAGVTRRWGSLLVATIAVAAMLGLSLIFPGLRNVAALPVAWVLGFLVPELPAMRGSPWWAQVLVVVAVGFAVMMLGAFAFSPSLMAMLGF
jgi:hypothetical protein